MAEYNPLKSYPYSKNRLLIIDWSSLAYHQQFAMVSKHSTAYLDVDSPEDELHIWKTKMVSRVVDYIKLFNPRDIILTLEGDNIWRNGFVKDYYNENATVYYDDTGYYLRYDNFLYKVSKDSKGELSIDKMDIVKDVNKIPKKHKKPSELPDRVRKIFWDHILPKYKGTRSNQYWPFMIDKKTWKNNKESFLRDMEKIFRCHVIGKPEAEGDDVIYVSTSYWKDKYDSMILVTGDSDMNQLLKQDNLKIYNHKHANFVYCDKPEDLLEIKVLSGDKSDNINGMALPNRKTQLGEKGATTLYESVTNCYEQAKEEGWDNQYMRNKKLIDLSKIPTHIQRELCEQLDKSNPKLGDMQDLYNLNITDKVVDEVNRLKTLGYYAVNSLASVKENPDMFDEKLFEDNEEEQKISTQRKFDNVGDVFDDPLSENIPDASDLF